MQSPLVVFLLIIAGTALMLWGMLLIWWSRQNTSLHFRITGIGLLLLGWGWTMALSTYFGWTRSLGMDATHIINAIILATFLGGIIMLVVAMITSRRR